MLILILTVCHGADVDSSSNVHVHDSTFDVGDDALCCKSGSVRTRHGCH
jgi:polygalacturonase